MITEELPVWVAAPGVAILGVLALYFCYIRPGYMRARKNVNKVHTN